MAESKDNSGKKAENVEEEAQEATWEEKQGSWEKEMEDKAEKWASDFENKANEWDKSNRGKDNASRYTWGVFFIFIGIVLLLNSTGVLPWSSWGYLVKFWPLLIVMIGLSIIFDGSKWFGWVTFVISVFLFGGILLLLLTSYNTSVLDEAGVNLPNWVEDAVEKVDELEFTEGKQMSSSDEFLLEDYPDTERLILDSNIGASEFIITDKRDENLLLLIESEYYEDFGVPEIDNDFDDGELTVKFSQEKGSSVVDFPKDSPFYTFTLGRDDIKTDINIDLGAGKGTVELSRTTLNDVEASVGAGELKFDLSGEGLDKTRFDFNIGAGKVELNLPRDVGYMVKYSVGIGALEIEGDEQGSIGKDGVLRSDNLDSADQTVIINVDVGVGEFKLN